MDVVVGINDAVNGFVWGGSCHGLHYWCGSVAEF